MKQLPVGQGTETPVFAQATLALRFQFLGPTSQITGWFYIPQLQV